MKITDIVPWLIEAPAPSFSADEEGPQRIPMREYVFVEVKTDEGLTGWGEITGTMPMANRAVCAMLRHLSGYLSGTDPRLIERTWNRIFRQYTAF